MSFRKNKWMYLLAFTLSLPFLNIGAFVITATCLGGDALSGRVENGRYFLAAHGRYTEVSEAVFNYSRIHAYSVRLTVALFALAIFILGVLKCLVWVLGRTGHIRR